MKFYKMSIFCRKVTAFTLLLLLSLSLLSPLAVRADDNERTIQLKESFDYGYSNVTDSGSNFNATSKITGEGHFVVRSYYSRVDPASENGSVSILLCTYIFSDKPFTLSISKSGGRAGTFNDYSCNAYKGIYYYTPFYVNGNFLLIYEGGRLFVSWDGVPNLEVVSTKDDVPRPEEIIDSGILDLTRDSYRDPDPDTDGTLSSSIPTPKIHVN